MNPVRATIETDCKTTGIPLRGLLVKRLGHASMGFPDGKPYWFLHLREPDEFGEWDIINGFDSCKTAMDARDDLKKKKKNPELYVISGPFVSYEDDVERLRVASTPELALAADVSSAKVDTPIKSVVLVFKDGRKEVELDATEYDALFWGHSSVHKFAVPYYVSANGLKYGVRVNEKFRGKTLDGTLTGEPSAYALVHEPDTEYALRLNPGGGGTPEVI